MLPRRRPDAVHRAYAEDEPGAGVEGPGAEGEPLEPPGPPRVGDDLPQPPFAGLATGLGRRNRVAAMALLGAVVGVLVVLLAHGMHAPAGSGRVASIPRAMPVVSVPAPPARQAVVVKVRRVRDMPKARRVQAAPAIRAAAAPVAGDVASVATQSDGSEFGFER